MRFRHFAAGWGITFLLSSVAMAEPVKSGEVSKDFSVTPSSDWIELLMPLQGVVVSYGKKETLATFHIHERELDGDKTVQDLKWEDLFSPQFESIDIRREGETVIGGQRARYCIYSLKPGPFKTQMEGKLPAKYMNYVLIHHGKLFSITFKDTEEGFGLNYPSFLAAIRTLKFQDAGAETPARTL